MPLRRAALSALLGLAACSKNPEAEKAKARIFGNEPTLAPLDAKRREQLDVRALDRRAEHRERLFRMSFEEVVARMGFVKYTSRTELKIGGPGQNLVFKENALIEQGLGGDFHVLKKNGRGEVEAEVFWVDRTHYLRDGSGQLRRQTVATIDGQPSKVREEAYEPIHIFTAYYGPRLGLRPKGPVESSGRPALKYELFLAEGDDLVKFGEDVPKRPKLLRGALVVDEQTAVILELELQGEFEVPNQKDPSGPAGFVGVDLAARLEPIEGKQILPEKYVDELRHQAANTDPLAFLSGPTTTSTVITAGPAAGSQPTKAPKATADDRDDP